MSELERRTFLGHMAAATGGVVLLPVAVSCGRSTAATSPGTTPVGGLAEDSGGLEPEAGSDRVRSRPPHELRSASTAEPAPPDAPPDDWDPVAFNRARGNAGAIPDSYLPDINGPEGVTHHIGKHLPYVPDLGGVEVPAGFIAIMWGDPARGHVMHPNAVPREDNDFEGHWYQWITLRKATDGPAVEVTSTYTGWPEVREGDSGSYASHGGGDITRESGVHTVQLAALPPDVQPGDRVRVVAHCLTHGEYVDFLEHRTA